MFRSTSTLLKQSGLPSLQVFFFHRYYRSGVKNWPIGVHLNSFLNISYSKIEMEKHSFINSRGALIVLEGLDRSGKTSQSEKMEIYLKNLGFEVELWRFPDRNTSVGQMISSYLSKKSDMDDHTVHLLFSANRWEKRTLMEHKLRAGTTLIVDRYSYSGVAFSSAKGLSLEWCKAPERGLLAPDVVIYLDIHPEEAAARGCYGDERYEEVEFQRRVSEQYQILKDDTWKVVNGSSSIEDVEQELKKISLEVVESCHGGKPLVLLWNPTHSSHVINKQK